MRLPREPVLFERIFIGTSGVLAFVSGAYLLALGVWRLWNPAPAPPPLPRTLTVTFTFAFIVSVLATGVCLIMIALSERVWKSTS